MGKHDKRYEKYEQEETVQEEMTMAEAKAYRASLNKEVAKNLTDDEKREAFRIFWAQAKSKYAKSNDLEQIIWLHLTATMQDTPEQFEDGLKHFGLTQVR